MPRLTERAFALIGRHIVFSIVIAVILVLNTDAVPFWDCVPADDDLDVRRRLIERDTSREEAAAAMSARDT